MLFTNGATLTDDQRGQLFARAVGVVDAPVTGLVVQDDQLTGVQVGPGQVVPRAAVFVRPQFVPTDTLLARPRLRHPRRRLDRRRPDQRHQLLRGLGRRNVVNPRAQVITAAGEASAAAIAINNDLVEEDIPIAVTHFRLGLPV